MKGPDRADRTGSASCSGSFLVDGSSKGVPSRPESPSPVLESLYIPLGSSLPRSRSGVSPMGCCNQLVSTWRSIEPWTKELKDHHKYAFNFLIPALFALEESQLTGLQGGGKLLTQEASASSLNAQSRHTYSHASLGAPRCPSWWSQSSARLVPLLLALLLLPFLIDILCLRSFGGGLSRLDPRSHFQTNMRGESIYMTRAMSSQMTRRPARGKVNAAIVVLTRNEDIDDVLLSLHRMEKRFNHKYLYDYIFLNNGDFDYDFRDRIPEEHWSYPAWISPEGAAQARKAMSESGVLYGSRESYHHMCRYFSGFIHKHPLLKEYDYYWRMEPNVHYYCDLDYDPFLYMQENDLKYGFVITILELPKTIPTLWGATKDFMRQNPALIPERNLMSFVTAPDGTYNLCHFWSNFEIGDLNFFRSKAYQKYFDHLDRQGGFYMERWGDAPVHSLAVAMLLNSSEVHFFQDIGYRHNSMKHCPATQRNHCDCDAIEAVSFHKPSFGICHQRWDDFLASGG